MTKPSNTQSQKRFNESLGSIFTDLPHNLSSIIFLKSSTDTGVVRNGGRNGARFAPKSFLSFFKKLALNLEEKISFAEVEVSLQALEENDFHLSQLEESKNIEAILGENPHSRIIHLGGGHDHIYPLLRAYSKSPRIIVINVDAHADTRTDENFHSGTPFRQFASEYAGDFHILQVGLHPFANSQSTLSALPKGKSEIIWKNDLSEQTLKEKFTELKKLASPDSVVIFSLDADALSGSLVPGVSAVNGDGLSLSELVQIWTSYKEIAPHATIMGIYELNPLYDNLSGMSMRTLSNFVFSTMR